MKPRFINRLLASTVLLASVVGCSSADTSAEKKKAFATCAGDNSGLSLPPGFCATLFADGVGHARHMAAAPDGTLYVNTWSGMYYGGEPPRSDAFLVALKDNDGDGRADVEKRFGPTAAAGSGGGTGIALYRGWLYAEVKDRISRWKLTPGSLVPQSREEVIVSGLPTDGEHPMHQFVIDKTGNLFVNIGSASNACEVKMGVAHPKAHDPCRELLTRAGIWRFSALKTGQSFSPAQRYATGIRNIGGMRLDAAGRLIVTQHGRDVLHQNWPEKYSAEQSAELPAEELLVVREGADFGWPHCYFDGARKSRVLAPEYGGDGKTVGPCGTKNAPAAWYPAHWAPNDIAIYSGPSFPAGYHDGLFIAFHGSWNRAPLPQGGFKVVFQPFANGKATGKHLVFADGFLGNAQPDQASSRPAGLSVGADGALYISDDRQGRIWKVTYSGPADAMPTAAAKAVYKQRVSAVGAQDLLLPPGRTSQQLALGKTIFNGDKKGGTCSGCHGVDGAGGAMAPALNKNIWLWSDGSVAGLEKVIRSGVAEPKKSNGVMPPLGGSDLSGDDVRALSSYIWAISNSNSVKK